jgi:parallel beta-helix repeat protein
MKALSSVSLVLIAGILLVSLISFSSPVEGRVAHDSAFLIPYKEKVEVEITAPNPGQVFNQSKTVNIEVTLKSTFPSKITGTVILPDKTEVDLSFTQKSKKFYEATFTSTSLVGDYIIEVNATSMFGKQAIDTLTFKVRDSTPPETTDDAPTEWTQGPVTVELTCVDNVGCFETYYCFKQTPGCDIFQSYYAPFDIYLEDHTYLRYYSEDYEGNLELVKEKTVKIDNTAPVTTHDITGTPGSNGYWTSSVDITLTCDDPLSGCKETLYCIDQSDICDPDIPYTTTVTHSLEGTSYFRFHSEDNAANLEDVQSLEIEIDTSTPTITISSPENTTYSSGDIDYIAKADEIMTIIEYSIDGGQPQQLTYNSNLDQWESLSGSHPTLADGPHYITFTGQDRAGHEADPVEAYFTIETGPPETTCSSCGDCTSKLNGDYAKVTLNTSIDNQAGTCILFGANDITFDGGNNIIDGDGTGNGIDLNGYSGVTVQNAEVKEFLFGIYSNGGGNNKMVNNFLHHNKNTGLVWLNGDGFTVVGNLIEWNDHDALATSTTSMNTLENNTIQLNYGYGINFYKTSSTTIKENMIFANGDHGIQLYSSNSNLVYNNDLLGNKDGINQVFDNGNNNWNENYPVGGNYWYNYDEPSEGCYDDYSGANQNQSGSDGICDSPYINGITDNYPWTIQSGWP